MKRLFSILFLLFLSVFLVVPVFACDMNVQCENITKSVLDGCSAGDTATLMSKCQEAFSNIEKAAKPHRAELDKMNAAIAAFQARITQIEADVIKKTAEIARGEKELEGSLVIASDRIRRFYMRGYVNNSMYMFLSSSNIGSVLRTLGYQQAAVNEDKKVITQTAVMVKSLEDKKATLEGEKTSLATLKTDTDRRADAIRKLLAQVSAYEGQLQSAIAAISARQQDFLAQKLAGLGIPLFAISGGGCSSDLTNGKNPSFSGGFGFFSLGVPNRVGLNQYGAWGRAKAHQDYDTILKAYYNFSGYQDFDVTIKVNDGGGINQGNVTWSGSLDNYVKRVYEVPDSWTDNDLAALKAQAVAVRSYALAATNNGANSICATQQCQVFKDVNGQTKGGNWDIAVDATPHKAMVKDGQPIKAFFSSTHGGYAYNTGDLQGWSSTPFTKRMVDSPNGSFSGFSDLRSNAFDKDSPWFYCDWGGRSSEGGTAWLRPEEVADIVNVILLAQQDSSSQKHLVQTDKPNPDGVDTWDASTVRSKLGSAAFTTISNVSISADFGTGRVTNVSVSGNADPKSFDGDTFKTYFNLRAPANIQIVGPLFNVERH